jgi:hypothetical protein
MKNLQQIKRLIFTTSNKEYDKEYNEYNEYMKSLNDNKELPR